MGAEDSSANSSASNTWAHPQLGQFLFDGGTWTAEVEAPAFDVFIYSPAFLKEPYVPSGRYPLQFLADTPAETPSAAAVDLALKVLAPQEALVSKVTTALWEDLNGRGPQSGMWWYGGLDQIADDYEEEDMPALASADDLHNALALSSISIRQDDESGNRPVVELSFDAFFEEEHGVGILTDGEAILGTGYMISVRPFRDDRSEGHRWA